MTQYISPKAWQKAHEVLYLNTTPCFVYSLKQTLILKCVTAFKLLINESWITECNVICIYDKYLLHAEINGVPMVIVNPVITNNELMSC